MPANPAAQAPAAGTAPALELVGIRHGYAGRDVLDIPHLQLERGHHGLVLGPSGSGKTTFLHVVAGILKPDQGDVRIGGQSIAAMTPAEIDRFRGRNIGIVFQTLHLIGAITVRDNLRLAASLAGRTPDDARITTVLDSLGIGQLAGRRPKALSQGEAQRVAIARAVINEPTLILADEPTSALDDTSCEAVLALLLSQAERAGASLLIATHDSRLSGRFETTFRLEGTR